MGKIGFLNDSTLFRNFWNDSTLLAKIRGDPIFLKSLKKFSRRLRCRKRGFCPQKSTKSVALAPTAPYFIPDIYISTMHLDEQKGEEG